MPLLDQSPKTRRAACSNPAANWVLLALQQKTEARKGIDQLLATGKVPEALLQDAALKMEDKDYAGARVSHRGSSQPDP